MKTNKRSKFYNIAFQTKVIQLFKKGKSSKEISEILNISKTALIRNLDKLGYNFDRSKSMQKYNLNRNYFSNIDSYKKAYWLGLIYADGSNKVSKNVFVLGLKQEDSYILELLKKDIKSDVPIKIAKDKRGSRQGFYRLEIYNKQFCLDLLKQGVFENKTSILKPPTLNENLIYSFIRGYFDGDGSICTVIDKNNNKHFKDSITFTGTKEIVDYISKYLKKTIDVNCNIYERHPERNNNNYTISINGRRQVIKLCEKMYENNNNHYLTRKYEKFLKIKNRYE
jgi:hypothetical protein